MPKQTVIAFIEAINAHDIAKIGSLLTDGHIFIDAHENHFQGKEMMKEGWKMYFRDFPDYKIEAGEFYEEGHTVLAVGHASATVAENGTINPNKHWRRPAVWKAIVSNNLIQSWQVFVDTKIVFDLLQK